MNVETRKGASSVLIINNVDFPVSRNNCALFDTFFGWRIRI